VPDVSSTRAGIRAAIIDAAADLLRKGGPTAVTTRGVAESAGVQAPTIYRLFGDKDGLLDAVAERVMADFVSAKTTAVAAAMADEVDPVENLRTSWHQQIDFGLTNPAVFRLLSDPDRVLASPAAQAGREVLVSRVHRLALAGHLRVSEQRAVNLIQAAGIGTIQTLLATSAEQRDPELAAAMLDAVLGRILTEPPVQAANEPVTTAIALRALAPQLDALSISEQHLLTEWLDRITASPSVAPNET
jgi:AcrR family transcriptional regulator